MSGKKTNAMRLLDEAGIVYQTLEYPTADGRIDGLSVAGKIGREAERVFKTLVTVSACREHFVFLVPVNRELDLKLAAQAAKQKNIALIPAKTLLPLTGYLHGGCSPVGMKKHFPTFIDESAVLYDAICVSGGRIGINLELSPARLAAHLAASFVDLTGESQTAGHFST
ncbi:Cys-tRNA(Pro) deacylase [Victivallis sp. Marseille-Q1083]|uniref:Cys-tRNA(Pro) deacylase n=1 Tax=Victivallis sp. Marseille-Q1083 TaxID=2717288 RepID=UPI00158EDEFF|nr:Cys-tRNA(Pro) deacylase [Victivallis sp. Marseille-Q1083]